MEGCIYRTKDGECGLWEIDRNHKPFCDPEHCDNIAPTNADRIRAMTDEELAKMLSSSGKYFCHGNGYDPHSEWCDLGEECESCWLDWLKQEAE